MRPKMRPTNSRGRSFGGTGTLPGSVARKSLRRRLHRQRPLPQSSFRLALHGRRIRVLHLEPAARPAFLEACAKEIAALPELGDGALHGTIVRVQRMYFDPPDIDGRMPRTSKWER